MDSPAGGALEGAARSSLASMGGSPPAVGVLPLPADDLSCPICRETLDGVVTTPCGHSFCFVCISTHLGVKKSCPSCNNYLTEDHIHPNFLLNKVGAAWRGFCGAALASGSPLRQPEPPLRPSRHNPLAPPSGTHAGSPTPHAPGLVHLPLQILGRLVSSSGSSAKQSTLLGGLQTALQGSGKLSLEDVAHAIQVREQAAVPARTAPTKRPRVVCDSEAGRGGGRMHASAANKCHGLAASTPAHARRAARPPLRPPQLLQDKRQQLETQESQGSLQLLLLFLQRVRDHQGEHLSSLQQQLHTLKHDLTAITGQQQRQQAAAEVQALLPGGAVTGSTAGMAGASGAAAQQQQQQPAQSSAPAPAATCPAPVHAVQHDPQLLPSVGGGPSAQQEMGSLALLGAAGSAFRPGSGVRAVGLLGGTRLGGGGSGGSGSGSGSGSGGSGFRPYSQAPPAGDVVAAASGRGGPAGAGPGSLASDHAAGGGSSGAAATAAGAGTAEAEPLPGLVVADLSPAAKRRRIVAHMGELEEAYLRLRGAHMAQMQVGWGGVVWGGGGMREGRMGQAVEASFNTRPTKESGDRLLAFLAPQLKPSCLPPPPRPAPPLQDRRSSGTGGLGSGGASVEGGATAGPEAGTPAGTHGTTAGAGGLEAGAPDGGLGAAAALLAASGGAEGSGGAAAAAAAAGPVGGLEDGRALTAFSRILTATTQYSRLQLVAKLPTPPERGGSGAARPGAACNILSSIAVDASSSSFATAGEAGGREGRGEEGVAQLQPGLCAGLGARGGGDGIGASWRPAYSALPTPQPGTHTLARLPPPPPPRRCAAAHLPLFLCSSVRGSVP